MPTNVLLEIYLQDSSGSGGGFLCLGVILGPNGKLDNGIASANKLGTGRVIVPVTIIGDQDGQRDRAAWKTEAFYGDPLMGFTAPQ
jgi:hypothetical protein